jgi:hypothetical protein
MRSNYWSCGDFADWIRGTKYPEYESSEGWVSIQKLAKATHPLRFWIAEELLDKLQDIVMFPSDTFYNIKYYVENRWVSRTHGLTAHPKDIKPGDWCDVGYRFLPCMFNELVDFVEVELAWSFIRWDDKAQYEKYNVPNFHWRSWRSKQAGLDYLDWASELVYENKDKTHYDLSPQALAAIEMKTLYLWWTEEYPKRKDPIDESGLGDFYNYEEEKYGTMFNNNRTKEEEETSLKLLMLSNDIEVSQEQEDEDMMIRLIKVRHHMWT